MDQLGEFISQPTGVVVTGVIAFLIGYVAMLLGNRVEERRKDASRVADHLSKIGLELLPEILRDYSVGDYSGALDGIKNLNRELDDPARRMVLLERLFKGVVNDLLRDPDQRPRVEKFFMDQLAATKPDRTSEFLQAANVVFNQKSILEELAQRQGLLGMLANTVRGPGPAVLDSTPATVAAAVSPAPLAPV